MSEDYDNRARIFNANIEGCLRELSSNLAVDAEKARTSIVAAYRQDLIEIDSKVRVLDDVIAICKIGEMVEDSGKYRKIKERLQSEGYLSA